MAPAAREVSPAPVPDEAAREDTSAPHGTDEDVPPAWLDEQAESAFRAEARDRGESVRVTRPAEDAAEEAEPGNLPQLDELVARIPADVRETLEDLFRARFVAVKRVPRKILKTP